jgi:murein DD-endopeptidase MepM/ murein hydrolase activator NlpD
VVSAIGPGTATITAYSAPGSGLIRVVVHEDFRLPLPAGRHWLLLTEIGTPTVECAGKEGGLRRDGGHDCSHSGVSRYSLDFAAVTLEEGAASGAGAVEVRAAAGGTVVSICLPPVPTATCGPHGSFVVVEHAGGFRAVYSHLDPASVSIRRKMSVTRGQPLGIMATSGTEPYAWVHFELRFENKGATAAERLGTVILDGRKLTDYRVDPGAPGFYRSTNSGDRQSPE